MVKFIKKIYGYIFSFMLIFVPDVAVADKFPPRIGSTRIISCRTIRLRPPAETGYTRDDVPLQCSVYPRPGNDVLVPHCSIPWCR